MSANQPPEELHAAAIQVIAEARARCAALGLSPQQLAQLLLPEALLAMMVAGMRQEEVEETFAQFARAEIPAWFLQVKRVAGYCDCEREARAGHDDDCLLHSAHAPITRRILEEASGRAPA